MRLLSIRVYVDGVALALEKEVADDASLEVVLQEVGSKGFLHSGQVYYPPHKIQMIHVMADVNLDDVSSVNNGTG